MQVQRPQRFTLFRGMSRHKWVTPLLLVSRHTRLRATQDADAAAGSSGLPIEDPGDNGASVAATDKGGKFERRVPGFPGVVVEFDEPEAERKKGTFNFSAVLLTSAGIVLMFSIITTLLSLAS